MGGRRALLLGAVSTAFLAACGKSRRPPPPLVWHEDLDLAYDEARRRGVPVFIQFGASWDCASKELEYRTFPDAEVAGRLATDFVTARVDCSDDENATTMRLTRRFDVKGTPTLIVADPRTDGELLRANEFVPPERLVTMLDEAHARYVALSARAVIPKLTWGWNVDEALAEATARRRPLLLFFGPAYDHGSKRIRDDCFTDWRVARLLHDSFALCDVWCNDGANAAWERFGVRGSPTSIVMDAARRIELARSEWATDARTYARFLRDALKTR